MCHIRDIEMNCESGKNCFYTEQQAKKYAKSIAGFKFGSRKKKMRVYFCDLCSFWHLTKEAKEFYPKKGRGK